MLNCASSALKLACAAEAASALKVSADGVLQAKSSTILPWPSEEASISAGWWFEHNARIKFNMHFR
jgi:hypothetical protein